MECKRFFDKFKVLNLGTKLLDNFPKYFIELSERERFYNYGVCFRTSVLNSLILLLSNIKCNNPTQTIDSYYDNTNTFKVMRFCFE